MAVIFLLVFIWVAAPASAASASASASLGGPGSVRAGDTITLTFHLSGSGLSGASGTLSYDGNQLSLTSTKQIIGAPWVVEFNGNSMVAYDNNLTNPITAGKDLFSLTFRVKDVPVGTKITVTYNGVKASDGASDANIGAVSYNATIAAPLSSNNNLASMTVGNASISPAFSKGTTSYTANVPFSVAKLDVQAAPEDSTAKVTVNSPNLTAGGTTNVTVTVTAENGSKKTYTIQVKREQDPNYKPSENNTLSSIAVEGFRLSPVFDGNVLDYVVWLPYEVDSIKIGAKADDSKANVEINGGESLAAGQDNVVKVTCIAENGTKKVYTIHAMRAAAHDGSVDSLPASDSSALSPVSSGAVQAGASPLGGVPVWAAILILIGGLGIGFAGGYLLKDKFIRR